MKAIALAVVVACSSTAPSPKLPVDPPGAPVVAAPPPASEKPMPEHPWPSTKQVAVTETIHGVAVADPYRWLEDEKAADVQAWMTAQDDHARAALAKLPARAELQQRLHDLLYYEAMSAPQVRKGRYFYTRKHVDKEKAIVYWRQGETGAEHVLFDPNTWSTDNSAGLGAWEPSLDGKRVAYARKEHNSDESVMHVLDVASGKDLPDVIAGTKYSSASWTPDGKGFYYTWVPPVGGEVTIADRPGFAEVRFHPLGGDPATDPVVYPATHNPKWFVYGAISEDGHWVIVNVQHGWNSSDLYFKDARGSRAAMAAAKWTPLVEGVDANFELEVWRDKFYVKTNDGAPRYHVYKVDPKQPARAAWKEIVAEPAAGETSLQSVRIVGEHLALTYLRAAATEIALHDLDGKRVRDVELPPLGTSAGLVGNPGDDTAFFSYTSFTEPSVVYRTSVKTGKVTEWSRVALPIDTKSLTTEQVFYPSKDGTKISMFIVHRRDAKQDGKAPLLLSGYGGFNVSETPAFSASRALFVERGGIYALPNLRGGGEYGEDWHRRGMLLAKQNVFDDFIAAAEYLVKAGWTSREHLGISGGSNGGLLVGAALVQRPDLFRAVVCSVPLLDMLRYHLYGSGKTWIEEYGSADDAAQFKALYAYSPYRVAVDARPARYPAVLFDSADHDDRVDPMHARKLAAVIQNKQTGDLPVLLRIERNAGHGGADVVKQQVERAADQLAFLESQLK